MRFIYTKTFIIFFICLAITALVVFMETKGWFYPVKTLLTEVPRPLVSAARSVTRPVKNFISTIYQLKKITRENTRLSEKAILLEQDLMLFDQIKKENEILKKELGFVRAAKQAYYPCTVLSQNPLGLLDTILVNCGTDQGVTEGQGVASQGYLVGKVIYASKNSSTVLLMTSSKFTVDARLSQPGAAGIVGGSFGAGLFFDRLSQNDQIEKGSLVVTAGINDKIPKNLLLGEVGDVISGSNDLFKKTTVISPIDFGNIDFVMIPK